MQEGTTSLQSASAHDYKEVVELLLDRGASVDKADSVIIIHSSSLLVIHYKNSSSYGNCLA